MSIRRTATPPQATPDDLQFTHRGRRFFVEITDIGSDFRAMTLFEMVNGAWAKPVGSTLNANLEIPYDAEINAAGGAAMWMRANFLPWINALLAEVFPPVEGAPLPSSGIDQIDALMGTMFVVMSSADGTVRIAERA